MRTVAKFTRLFLRRTWKEVEKWFNLLRTQKNSKKMYVSHGYEKVIAIWWISAQVDVRKIEN